MLVEEMLRPRYELLVGSQGAANGYPPVLTVGFGGTRTELFADVASALAPVSAAR